MYFTHGFLLLLLSSIFLHYRFRFDAASFSSSIFLLRFSFSLQYSRHWEISFLSFQIALSWLAELLIEIFSLLQLSSIETFPSLQSDRHISSSASFTERFSLGREISFLYFRFSSMSLYFSMMSFIFSEFHGLLHISAFFSHIFLLHGMTFLCYFLNIHAE